ncbi:MAG: hypothetical protein KKC46_15905 [Proteobacteria bacterium]|nr:hypothetical protein [Pseudomonadota bacterium]
MSKRYHSIDIAESEIVADLRKKNNRPLVIACSGPSVAEVDYYRIPGNPVIFRMNLFFLEQDYLFGKHVDAYFWAVYREVIQDELYDLIIDKKYNVENYFYPMKLVDENRSHRLEIDKIHEKIFQPAYDHWNLMSTVPEIARIMMVRPIPTVGLQALATGLILGFKEIYIIGMDFYQSTDKRYGYEIPDRIKSKTSPMHFKVGYEQKAHSFENDTYVFSVLQRLFPEVKIYSLAPRSYLSELTGLSPLREKENNLFVKKNIIGTSRKESRPINENIILKSKGLKKKIIPFIYALLSIFAKYKFGRKVLIQLKHDVFGKLEL